MRGKLFLICLVVLLSVLLFVMGISSADATACHENVTPVGVTTESSEERVSSASSESKRCSVVLQQVGLEGTYSNGDCVGSSSDC